MKKQKDNSKPYGIHANRYMPIGCLYLNNDGSRWVCQDMRFVLVLPDGSKRVRLAVCYESFGNFASTVYKYQGRTYKRLPKSHEEHETQDQEATGIDALPHIFHERIRP